MATEKGIVNVSQTVLSLSYGRLQPGQILRVRDHYRKQNGYMQDVMLKQYITAGCLSVQDIDFDALAQARQDVQQQEAARQVDWAKAAIVQAEAEKAAEPVPPAPAPTIEPREPAPEPVDDIAALYETQRKERIARVLEERGASQAPEPEPTPQPSIGGRRRVRK